MTCIANNKGTQSNYHIWVCWVSFYFSGAVRAWLDCCSSSALFVVRILMHTVAHSTCAYCAPIHVPNIFDSVHCPEIANLGPCCTAALAFLGRFRSKGYFCKFHVFLFPLHMILFKWLQSQLEISSFGPLYRLFYSNTMQSCFSWCNQTWRPWKHTVSFHGHSHFLQDQLFQRLCSSTGILKYFILLPKFDIHRGTVLEASVALVNSGVGMDHTTGATCAGCKYQGVHSTARQRSSVWAEHLELRGVEKGWEGE